MRVRGTRAARRGDINGTTAPAGSSEAPADRAEAGIEQVRRLQVGIQGADSNGNVERTPLDRSLERTTQVAKRKLPEALRANADRLKRGESLHGSKKGQASAPKPKPKIRSAKNRKG
jgi:hypothetical protein